MQTARLLADIAKNEPFIVLADDNGKVHRILKKHGLTNLDVLTEGNWKTCSFTIDALIVDTVA